MKSWEGCNFSSSVVNLKPDANLEFHLSKLTADDAVEENILIEKLTGHA